MFDSTDSNLTSQVMRGLYLIQRLEKRTNPAGYKGVDQYVDHDYMGSSEFEFGAVPATWKKFRANSKDLVRTSVQLLGLTFLCIAHKSISKEELVYSLRLLLEDKVHVKESTYMPERLARKGTYHRKTVAWLRIGANHAPLLWTVSPELCKKLCEELEVPNAEKISTAFFLKEAHHPAVEYPLEILSQEDKTINPIVAGEQKAYTGTATVFRGPSSKVREYFAAVGTHWTTSGPDLGWVQREAK